MANYKNRCIVRENQKIQVFLNQRFKQLKLTARAVTLDANKNGLKFNEQQLSRYRKYGNIHAGVSTSDVMWLCDRYCIEITLRAKKVKYTEGGIIGG